MKATCTVLWKQLFCSFLYVMLYQNHKIYAFISENSSVVITADQIDRCSMFFTGPGRQRWSLVRNGKKHQIPDRYTRDCLNCSISTVFNKSSHHSLPTGPPIKSLWNSGPNARLISLLNNRTGLVMQTYRNIMHIINPSVVFKGDDVLISGQSSKDTKFKKIWWFQNTSSLKPSLLEKDQIIFDDANYRTASVPVGKIYGEDPRLFTMSNNRTFLTLCHRFPKKTPELQMAYSELILRNHSVEVGPMVDIKYKEFASQDQKNWCPFEYDGKMLFVTDIHPHRVVALTSDPSWSGHPPGFNPAMSVIPGEPKGPFLSAIAVTASLTSMNNFTWTYGQMRGGTSPVYIGDNKFLSFFHSSNDVSPHTKMLKTYVMGAYVFDSRPPFAIQAISRDPIVHESIYNGKWSDLGGSSYYHIDYVVFPMSFKVLRGAVHLLYGKQDTEGWVAEMDLRTLLESLKVVESTTLSDIYQSV